MPEGHTLHRLARELAGRLRRPAVAVTSPQGRFAESAALLDGPPLVDATAAGKHLFFEFDGERFMHVHLGLIGKFDVITGVPTRRRRSGRSGCGSPRDGAHGVRRPARRQLCDLVTPSRSDAVIARLGPDPLRARRRPRAGLAPDPRSQPADRRPADGPGGPGRRRQRLPGRGAVPEPDPPAPARPHAARGQWQAIWADLVELMAEGVRTGRIDTVRPEHTPEAMGRAAARRRPRRRGLRLPARRAALPGLRHPVRTEVLAGRNLFWCRAVPAAVPLARRTVSRISRPDGTRPIEWLGPNVAAPSLARRATARARRGPLAPAAPLDRARCEEPMLAVRCSAVAADRGRHRRLPELTCRSPCCWSRWCWPARLTPRALPWFVGSCSLLLVALVACRPEPDAAAAGSPDAVFVLSASSSLLTLLPPVAARRGRSRRASRCWSTCATASSGRPLPALPDSWYAESALRSAGGTLVRRRLLRRRRPTHGPPRRRRGRRLRQGRRRRHPRAAAVRRLRRPARALPPREFLPAANDYLLAPGLGRGLRHGGAPLARPLTGRLRGPDRRPPAGDPPAAGIGRWAALPSEGPVLGLIDGAEFDELAGACAAATR